MANAAFRRQSQDISIAMQNNLLAFLCNAPYALKIASEASTPGVQYPKPMVLAAIWAAN
jgi:hypothetical protein